MANERMEKLNSLLTIYPVVYSSKKDSVKISNFYLDKIKAETELNGFFLVEVPKQKYLQFYDKKEDKYLLKVYPYEEKAKKEKEEAPKKETPKKKEAPKANPEKKETVVEKAKKELKIREVKSYKVEWKTQKGEGTDEMASCKVIKAFIKEKKADKLILLHIYDQDGNPARKSAWVDPKEQE